jgi:hypothetical protein
MINILVKGIGGSSNGKNKPYKKRIKKRRHNCKFYLSDRIVD